MSDAPRSSSPTRATTRTVSCSRSPSSSAPEAWTHGSTDGRYSPATDLVAKICREGLDSAAAVRNAHLSQTVGPPRRLAAGEVIGLTGYSGNADGGATHTHFQFHPGGGSAINPYPTLRASGC